MFAHASGLPQYSGSLPSCPRRPDDEPVLAKTAPPPLTAIQCPPSQPSTGQSTLSSILPSARHAFPVFAVLTADLAYLTQASPTASPHELRSHRSFLRQPELCQLPINPHQQQALPSKIVPHHSKMFVRYAVVMSCCSRMDLSPASPRRTTTSQPVPGPAQQHASPAPDISILATPLQDVCVALELARQCRCCPAHADG